MLLLVRHARTVIAGAALSCGIASAPARAQTARLPVRMLMLYGLAPDAPAVSVFTQRLRETVRDETTSPLEFYEEYLDLDRFPGRTPQLARYFAEKYRALRVDAIVAVGSMALHFATEQLDTLLPKVPVIFALTVENIIDVAKLPSNVTGRLIPLPFASTMSMARGLQPDARQVVIVGGVAAARVSCAVDWRQLKRWGLSENELPLNTEALFRTPSVWERYSTPILASLGLIVGQSLLIALLLLERQRRVRAQRGVGDQAAYEQTIADLTTNAVRHAPEEAQHAIEDALGRVARYAGADKAVLVQYADACARPATTLHWPYSAGVAKVPGDGSMLATPADGDDLGLQIPLEADGASIGMLQLYRKDVRQEWSPRLVTRLDAAGELIAGAMARAQAARDIRRGEELNRAVLASLSTQIAILDANGTIIRVNDAWRQVAYTGGVTVERHAFLGQNYLDECLRAEDRGCREAGDVRRGVETVLDRGAWHFRHEYNWSSPDARWYELRVDRLEHEDGGAIITHIDITDRHLAEVKAEETRRQVTHLGRVAMVGELAAAVSHELRQPLAAIRANAEAGERILEMIPPDLGEARQIFRDVVSDAMRAADTIDHIRSLLRKDEPTRRSVDLNEICRQAVHLLKRDALLRRTRLDLSLESRLRPIDGDPIQLQQVVLNLALNALDSASSSAVDPTVTVSTSLHGSEVEISVRDTGPGLPPNVEQHLFESFFSTKAHGLGMGLVIVRSIVERHHGRVRAENDVSGGGGAVFRVLLPTS